MGSPGFGTRRRWTPGIAERARPDRSLRRRRISYLLIVAVEHERRVARHQRLSDFVIAIRAKRELVIQKKLCDGAHLAAKRPVNDAAIVSINALAGRYGPTENGTGKRRKPNMPLCAPASISDNTKSCASLTNSPAVLWPCRNASSATNAFRTAGWPKGP